MSILARLRNRRALHLKAEPVDPQSYMTQPERGWMEKAKTGSLATFHSLKSEASKSSNPFGGVLPKVKTLTTLAELGAPAKGEYERTYNTVRSLFGHDPDGVAAWQAVNASLSPRTEYLDHAGAASLITANWLAMGKPSDPDTIRNLIHRVHTFGKLYTPTLASKTPWAINPENKRWAGMPTGQGLTFGGTTAMGSNVDRAVRVLANVGKLREALMDPAGQPGENLSLLSGGGLQKVPNFAISYSAPRQGTALDMWMSHLLFHPSLDSIQDHSDFLAQVKYHLNDPSELNNIEKKAKQQYPVKSELVKALLKVPDAVVQVKRTGADGKTRQEPIKVAKFIQEMNSNLVTDMPVYMAYKHAVAEAAKKLGWTLAEVQETVWTGVVALAAAKSAGIPAKKIQDYLTHDAVRKGWQNHEAFIFPGVVDAYRRAGTDPSAVRELEQRTLEGAANRSRPGVLPISDPAHLRRITAYVPPSNRRGNDAAGPIRRAIIERLTQEGLFDATTGKMRMSRLREKLRLAQYDMPLDFVSALSRAVSADQQTFAEHLRHVLSQSGIQPHEVSPAVHDYGGAARASVLAAGSYKQQGAMQPHTGTAWTGLLGRQPGMLTFQGNATGPDSVYRFAHQDADAVRQALDRAGVKNRVLVPQDKTFHVFVYDQGRRVREGVAQALTMLGVPAEEWRGTGTPIGGKQDDMGREQYRGVINQSEATQAQTAPMKMAVDPDMLGIATGMHDKPYDRAPWLIGHDRAQELDKPYFAKMLQTLGMLPNPTRKNRTIQQGALLHDPHGIRTSAFASRRPSIWGHVGGFPINVQEDESGAFRVIFVSPHPGGKRLGMASVSREHGAGLLHEMEPSDSHPNYAHYLNESRTRHPDPRRYPQYYSQPTGETQNAAG